MTLSRQFIQIVAVVVGAVTAVPPAMADDLAVVGTTVIASPGAPALADATILISDGRIVALGKRADIQVPERYPTLEATGTFATAGFWNAHVHFADPRLLAGETVSDEDLSRNLVDQFARFGFTTVIDLASTTAAGRFVAGRVEAGAVKGPRILTAGEPFYPRGATPFYAKPIFEQFGLPSAEVGSATEAAARVRHQLAAGADAIKIFSGSIVGGDRGIVHMDIPTIRAITAAAHQAGKLVLAHPTDRAGVDNAVAGGIDILAHAAPLMGAWSEEYARSLVGAHVALIPTLSLFAAVPDKATPVAVAVDQARRFSRAGGSLLFGTDAGFTDGFDPSKEFVLMTEAVGLDHLLAALTTNPAARFGGPDRTGRLETGQTADIVLLGADPRASVAAFGDVEWVIRSGEVQYANPGRVNPVAHER